MRLPSQAVIATTGVGLVENSSLAYNPARANTATAWWAGTRGANGSAYVRACLSACRVRGARTHRCEDGLTAQKDLAPFHLAIRHTAREGTFTHLWAGHSTPFPPRTQNSTSLCRVASGTDLPCLAPFDPQELTVGFQYSLDLAQGDTVSLVLPLWQGASSSAGALASSVSGTPADVVDGNACAWDLPSTALTLAIGTGGLAKDSAAQIVVAACALWCACLGTHVHQGPTLAPSVIALPGWCASCRCPLQLLPPTPRWLARSSALFPS